MQADILARYDAEMRRDPPLTAGLTLTRAGGVVRLGGLYNCIVYSASSAADAPAQVAAEVAHLKRTGGRLEWKVHGHDQPGDLPEILARHGFAPEPMETLMVRAIDASLLELPVSPGITIRTAASPADFAAYAKAAAEAFGHPVGDDPDALLTSVECGEAGLHVACLDGEPAGVGRVDLPPGRSFAGLYTGGVAPAHRGRGLYRALVRSRARAAAARGYAFLITEALETSRPILEKLGFAPLTTVQGWVIEVEAGED